MRKLIKLIVTALLALCLPLQGVAGVTMPACAGQQDPAMQTMSAAGFADMESHCEHAKQAYSDKTDKTSHDKCYACYLSIVQALAPSALMVDSSGMAVSFLPMINDKYQAPPSSLFHPPRPISA